MSFLVNIGRASFPFPKNSGSDFMKLQNEVKQSRFHISGEYRFYLKCLNKFDAPHGVYIGSYYSRDFFTLTHKWELNTADYPLNPKQTCYRGIIQSGSGKVPVCFL